MTRNRIQLIDSFRFIAVMSVLLFHFDSPYVVHFPLAGDLFRFFKYGQLGVYFFFMISGFVISFTLENTANLSSFYFNRFVRLFPPILLCSLITFTVARCLDDHFTFANAHNFRNFLPSLTFINPGLLTHLSGHEFHWLNGSYWTLWIEVQFYLFSSAIYFLNKKRYFQNLLLAGIACALIKYIPIYLLNNYPQFVKINGWYGFFESWRIGDEIFNLTFFITWFICGSIFFQFYKGLIFKANILPVICTVIILYFLVADTQQFFPTIFYSMIIGALVMFTFFLLLISRDKYLFFLKYPLLYRIGMISYTIYLIHETIGSLLINKYSIYLGSWSFLSPVIITIIAILFAEVSYRIYEKPISTLLRKLYFLPRRL